MDNILTNTLSSVLKAYPFGIPQQLFESKPEGIRFIFLVKYQGKSKEEEFLNAIIEKGLKLTKNEVLITDDISSQSFHDEFLICFGEEAFAMLGEESGAMNQVTEIAGHDCLLTSTLSELMNNPQAKKDFWEELKQYA